MDSTNKTEDLLDYALELGLPGICITNHETTTSHIRAYQHIQDNKDRFKDFKVGYGNEIYLISENESNKAKYDNETIRYYHFILVAKNKNGHKGIRELSSQAWLNSYFHRGMQRVPLFKHQLKDIMKKYKGDIIASSACLGGEIPQLLLKSNNIHEEVLNFEEALSEKNYEEVNSISYRILGKNKKNDHKHNLHLIKEKLKYSESELEYFNNQLDLLITSLIEIFGDDFYLELQPSDRKIQIIVNKLLLELANQYNIKPIITTDAHYLNESKKELHQAYLNAKDGDREVASFYSSTYLMNRDTLSKYIDESTLDMLIDNTHEIMEKIETIDFGNKTQIPKAHIPDFSDDYIDFFNKYPRYEYIQKLLNSNSEQDQYYLYLIYKGIKNKSKILLEDWSIEIVLNRINLELEQIIELSNFFEQPMSGYFLFVKELVDIIWEVSFVAPNRGSAACWITNYLLDITQLNPLDYDIPYWRFLHIARGRELPDMNNVCTLFTQNEVYTIVC